MLADGRFAISGGPSRFEILIYNHVLTMKNNKPAASNLGRNDSLHIAESLDTQNMQVHHLLEL